MPRAEHLRAVLSHQGVIECEKGLTPSQSGILDRPKCLEPIVVFGRVVRYFIYKIGLSHAISPATLPAYSDMRRGGEIHIERLLG